jgi:hypothetical protein
MANVRTSLVVMGMVAAGLVGGLVARSLPLGQTVQAAEGAAKAVRAESFVLVDADGKEIAVLGQTADGTALTIKGKDGKTRAGLGVNPAGDAGLLVYDAQGRPRICASSTTEGSSVILVDASGKERMAMGLGPDGPGLPEQAGMLIRDQNQNIRFGMGVAPDGKGVGWDLRDADGKVRVAASDGPSLTLKDTDGHNRAELSYLRAEDYWSIRFLDAKGTSRIGWGARADGKASGGHMQDSKGVLRVGFGADEGTGTGLTLNNADGKEIVGIGVGPGAGGGDLSLKSPSDGHVVWRASQQARQEQPKAE